MIRAVIGFGLIILGFVLLLNPLLPLKPIEQQNFKYPIDSNINTTEVNFTFDKDYISNYYLLSEEGKDYKTFINLYIAQFKSNSTPENLTSVVLNDCLYIPENKSYMTSLVIEYPCMNEEEQTLELDKSSGYNITKAELEYEGINYKGEKKRMMFYFSIIVIFAGILFLFYRFK